MKKLLLIFFVPLIIACSSLSNQEDFNDVYFEENENQIIFEIKNDLKLTEKDYNDYQYDYRFVYKEKAVDCYSAIMFPLVSIINFSLTDKNDLIVNYQDYKYPELSTKNYDMSRSFDYFELNKNDNWVLKRTNEIYQYKFSQLLNNKLTVIGIINNPETGDSIEIQLRFRKISD